MNKVHFHAYCTMHSEPRHCEHTGMPEFVSPHALDVMCQGVMTRHQLSFATFSNKLSIIGTVSVYPNISVMRTGKSGTLHDIGDHRTQYKK